MEIKIKISEANIIRAIGDYLQIQKNQGKLMFIRNNSGAIPISDGKNKRRYIKFGDKGSPDFLVWKLEYYRYNFQMLIRADSIAFEVKSENGKQSKAQKEWQDDFENVGASYYIVRSVDEVIDILK